MWPKVLAQLFELLPHVTRLVPMADRYFSTKTASEKATEAAMAAMAESVRSDLGQVTQAQTGLHQQLQEQSARIAEVSAEIKRMVAATERVKTLESQVAALGWWVKAGGSLVVALLVAVIVLLVRGR
jgi:hypothetical protein